MKTPSFTPDLFERLLDTRPQSGSSQVNSRLSLDTLKDAVARDLEVLLNTRAVFPQELLAPCPNCQRSILGYGLPDFAGLSLSSTGDCAVICRALEQAIALHEPRLRNISATLDGQAGAINRLDLKITALLMLHPAQEHKEDVSFDAVLQASSLHYSIKPSRRPASQRA